MVRRISNGRAFCTRIVLRQLRTCAAHVALQVVSLLFLPTDPPTFFTTIIGAVKLASAVNSLADRPKCGVGGGGGKGERSCMSSAYLAPSNAPSWSHRLSLEMCHAVALTTTAGCAGPRQNAPERNRLGTP